MDVKHIEKAYYLKSPSLESIKNQFPHAGPVRPPMKYLAMDTL